MRKVLSRTPSLTILFGLALASLVGGAQSQKKRDVKTSPHTAALEATRVGYVLGPGEGEVISRKGNTAT